MFRYIVALILVAILVVSMNKSIDARMVHPIVTPEAISPSPASNDGRRLIGTTGHDELVALCQQVAHVGTNLICFVVQTNCNTVRRRGWIFFLKTYRCACMHTQCMTCVDALQDIMHHDDDATRGDDTRAVIGRIPADYSGEGGDDGDEARPGNKVERCPG